MRKHILSYSAKTYILDCNKEKSLLQWKNAEKKRNMGGRTVVKHKNTIKYAFLASIPVMAGYIVLGMGFGILLQDKGYAWWWAFLMSLTIYAGSMQYVGIDLLTGGATVIATALMTVMVNIRHLFYGISMLEKYSKTGKEKPYLIFSLTDETYSLVCDPDLPENVDEHRYYLYLSVMNQFYWVLGSVLGAVAGAALNFNSAGIDFAMTALFVVILLDQLQNVSARIPAAVALVSALVCLLIFGADSFILPALLLTAAALTALRPRLGRPEDKEVLV
jgi:4-azaleucine resistance transporter AzlC